jgi:glycosyltransferase involved in cell wall biosynthesis
LLDIGIPAERIHVKYLGVPVASAPRVRSPHSNPRELNILYLGRLVDCKGPDLTIRAFDSACQQGLQGRLILAGDGPMRAECERLRAASRCADQIEMLGAVDEATSKRLRSAADIFTAHNCLGRYTQQEEAFGVSIVEAMAAGLPIVSGANGSLPELVDDGEQGLLFPPGDIEAQATAFLKLANDSALRERLGRQAWERARERFTIEREMTALRSLLQLPLREEPAA